MGRPTASFLIGRAGVGKSHRLLERVCDWCRDDPLGPTILLLVPAQATFEYERHVALRVGGTLRVRVADPASLIDGAVTGEAARRSVDAEGRGLLVARAMEQEASATRRLREATRAAGTPGEVDETLERLRSSGVPADRWPAQAANDPAMAQRLEALAAIEVAYLKLLGDRLDPDARAAVAIERLRSGRPIAGALVVDGFRRFDATTQRLIVAVAAKAAETLIAVEADPDAAHQTVGESLFSPGDRAVASLRERLRDAGVALAEIVALRDSPRFSSPTLRLLEHDASQPRPSSLPPTEDVRLVEAGDASAVARSAAAQLRDWLHDGLSPRELGVLFRGDGRLRAELMHALAEADVPAFVDRRRSAAHHAATRLVRDLVTCAAEAWPAAAADALSRNPLVGIGPAGLRAIAHVVVRYHLRGRAAWEADVPWTSFARDDDDEASVAESARRPVSDAVLPLSRAVAEKQPVGELIAMLRETLAALGVADRVAELADASEAAGEVTAAQDRRVLWARIGEELDRVASLFGDEAIDAAGFTRLIGSALGRVDFAIPPPARQAVVVGEATRLVMPEGLRRVVVVDDGDQAQLASGAAMSERDARRLRELGIDVGEGLDPVSRLRRHDYHATTLAGERLTVVRLADGLAPPSRLWNRLSRSLPGSVERAGAPVATERDAVAAAICWAAGGAGDGDERAVLYEATRAGELAAVAWPALSYANDASLSPTTAATLAGETLAADARRLEDFAACPFRHFAKHTLALREPVGPSDMPHRDVAVATHQVLADVDGCLVNGELAGDDAEAVAACVAESLAKVARRSGRGLDGATPRGRYLLGRLERTIAQVVASRQVARSRGSTRPVAANVIYGDGARWPAVTLTTPRGRTLRLSGRLDRVDAAGPGRVAIDYRSSADAAIGDLRLRLAFKLVVDLLAIEQLGKGRSDAFAALAVGSRRRMKSCDSPAGEPGPDDPAFYLRDKPRGLVASSGLPLLDSKFANEDGADHHQPGRSDVLVGGIRKDGRPLANGDVLDDEAFDALVGRVREAALHVADAIADGDVSVRPFRHNRRTPCGRCGYRSLCRFEPPADRYRPVEPIGLPQEGDEDA